MSQSLTLFPVLSAMLCLSGCQVSPQGSSATKNVPFTRQGTVHGGQQPVSGATIQLYAVGTSGDASAATPLLTPAVLTDGNGDFTITGDYTCPSASALVYMVATGGNPGLGGNLTNPQLSLMAALGTCGTLTPSTFVTINELTTVAAVYSLAPFMTSASTIGSGAGDAPALAAAFAQAAVLVNTSTGASPGPVVPAGANVPTPQIDLLGNILSGCANSAGGVAGDNSYCGSLFSLTTPTTTPATAPPTNTVAALLNLANYPLLNTPGLFALPTATAPFQPVPSTTPSDLNVSLTYPAGLTASVSSLNFGSVTTGFLVSQTVIITNSSAIPVAYAPFFFTGSNSSEFTTLGSCTSPIAPGKSCTIYVEFQPVTSGSKTANLNVYSSALNALLSVPLGAQATPPGSGSATLSPASLTIPQFGVPQTMTLTNTGTSALTINRIGGAGYFVQSNTCGTSLAVQSSCTITVESQTGLYQTGTVTVFDDAAAGPQSSSITYTGVTYNGGGALASSVPGGNEGQENTWDYGTQTTFAIVLTAFGSAPIGTISGTITGSSEYAIQNGTSFQSSGPCVPTGPSTCTFLLSFEPTSSNNNQEGATLSTDAGNIPLDKSGTLDALNYQIITGFFVHNVQINTTGTGVYYVVNVGNAPLTFNTPTITGTNASQFTATEQCGTLPLAGECPITVTVTPTQPGPITATMTLTANTLLTVQVGLQVTGTPPPPVPGPTSLAFPDTRIGTPSTSIPITITNYQNDGIVILPTQSTPFTVSPTYCATTPCTVYATFTPTAAGPATGSITLADWLYGSSIQISATGNGTN
jgi:hypothetical protein